MRQNESQLNIMIVILDKIVDYWEFFEMIREEGNRKEMCRILTKSSLIMRLHMAELLRGKARRALICESSILTFQNWSKYHPKIVVYILEEIQREIGFSTTKKETIIAVKVKAMERTWVLWMAVP